LVGFEAPGVKGRAAGVKGRAAVVKGKAEGAKGRAEGAKDGPAGVKCRTAGVKGKAEGVNGSVEGVKDRAAAGVGPTEVNCGPCANIDFRADCFMPSRSLLTKILGGRARMSTSTLLLHSGHSSSPFFFITSFRHWVQKVCWHGRTLLYSLSCSRHTEHSRRSPSPPSSILMSTYLSSKPPNSIPSL